MIATSDARLTMTLFHTYHLSCTEQHSAIELLREQFNFENEDTKKLQV